MGPGTIGGVPSVESLSKGSYPVFTQVSEKTTENSERLGRQARPGFEPGTSRLPVLSVTTPPLVGQQMGIQGLDQKLACSDFFVVSLKCA